MKIESVDFIYVSMPVVRDIGDGSQDALLVRVRGGGFEGWGECEAAPLPSIAAWCCPMSHSACKPVSFSVLGRTIDSPDDIERIGHEVRRHSQDVLQADHTFSGVEIALWDLLGKVRGEPVYKLLGYRKAYPKTPYASQLFGDTPEETNRKAAASRKAGYRAVKFGWGVFGYGTVEADRDQLAAARDGLGRDGILLVDAGTVWVDDFERAAKCIAACNEFKATWLEEPFIGPAVDAYARLAAISGAVKIAGGEGAHNFFMAKHLIDYGRIGYVQIDTGRIGGIAPAKRVADYALSKGVTWVNHTFTTHGALAGSLAPMIGVESWQICEYPVEPTTMARELYHDELALGRDGLVRLPDSPGLGATPRLDAIKRYVVETELRVSGRTLYRTPFL